MKWKLSMAVAALVGGSLGAQELPVAQNPQEASVVNYRIRRNEDGLRQIRLLEDRDQKYMVSKVYELKHAKGADITPWVLGAVQRYYYASTVERLSYKKDSKEYIVVNTGVDMVPFVDDMVAKLDRPSKIDSLGSIYDGSGIYKFVYYPKYRFSPTLVKVGPTVGSEDGEYFFDAKNSFYYFKDSYSDGKKSFDWYGILDRPVPQMEVKLNIYEINDNDLKELGIDYVSWKNGPGAKLFGAGFDYFKFDSFTDVSNVTNSVDILSQMSHSWGGFMVAPQIDATFIRLLAQKGKAYIASSASLTVVNDFHSDPGNDGFSKAKYKIRFTPNYQDIQKDKDQNTYVKAAGMDVWFYLRNPVINFKGGYEGEKDAVRENGTGAACLEFGYVTRVLDTVEKTSNGSDAQNLYTFRSWASVMPGQEKLIGVFDRDLIVKQYNGIPFLGDIPGLKYLCGAATESKSKSQVFVTIEVKHANPDSNLSDFAGKLVSASDMMRKDESDASKSAEEVKKQD